MAGTGEEPTSEARAAWMILWRHAAGPGPPGPFEAADVVPELARALGGPEHQAGRVIATLLEELSRLPDGRQFFEGRAGAVVPLACFEASAKDDETARRSYPFEF